MLTGLTFVCFSCGFRGRGDNLLDVTWATLVAVLQETGLVKLASDIEAIKIS